MPNINLVTCSIEVDSTYIVVGQQLTNINNRRLTLYKLNYEGDTLQTTYYNVDTLQFFAQKIIRIRDNIYIYGSYAQTDLNASNKSTIFLACFNINFEFLWLKKYGGDFYNTGGDFKQTSDKGFIMTGSTTNSAMAKAQLVLLKTDSLGNEQWLKRYGWGGTTEVGYSVQQLFDGSYVASGYAERVIYPNGNMYYDVELYMVRTDSVGNLLWEKKWGTQYDDNVGFIKQLADSSLLLSGAIGKLESAYAKIGYLAKLNLAGEILWEKKYDFGNRTYFYHEVIEDESQNFVVSGTIFKYYYSGANKAFLMKFDKLGRLLRKLDYFTDSTRSQYIYGLKATSDKGFLLCGSAFDSLPIHRAWVIKTDCFGYDSVTYYFKDSICNLEDCKRYENDFSLTVFDNQLDLNSGESLAASTTLQENTTFMWDFGDGNTLQNEMIVSHHYPDTGTYELRLIFEKGMCQLSKSKQIKVFKPYLESNFALYPNPNDGNFNILHYFDQQVDLSITNALGQEVFRKEELSKQAHIKLFLASGLYFVSLTHEGKTYQQKMVVK